MTERLEDVTAVVLAGGRGSRMEGLDKGLVEVAGRPMVCWVVEALTPQVSAVVVNANRNLERYAELTGCPIVTDADGDFAGPLAGFAAALTTARTRYVLTAPCDSPLVAPDYAARLRAALDEAGAEICVACEGEWAQPVFSLLDRTVAPGLARYLDEGERKIDRWFQRHRLARADLTDRAEMFVNVNTPEERQMLERRLGGGA